MTRPDQEFDGYRREQARFDLAATKRAIVRRAYDGYRWVEQVLSPSLSPVAFGNGSTVIHERVEISEPFIALTFDDGPDPEYTPQVLDTLASRDVKATFYVIGEEADRRPDLVRLTSESGHELGNHTWSHRFLTTQTSRMILEEVNSTSTLIADITGVPPATMRPPYGATTKLLSTWVARETGCDTVLWSAHAGDWAEQDPQQIARRLVEGASRGSILLAHDPMPSSVAALPEILDRLLDEGFEFVTVGDLLEAGL